MRKKALSVLETSITAGIVIIVTILVVGMFSDGLKGVIANGGTSKILNKENSQKTAYENFNRDYSATQIEVQVTGVQGLEMLRKKANNLALKLINSDYKKNSVEIAYLARVVEILTGESYFCSYMQENSEKHCNEFLNYAYKATVSNALFIPEKTNKYLDLGDAATVLSSINVPKDAKGYTKYSENEAENTKAKYKAIYDLTTALKNLVSDKSVLLMTTNNSFIASDYSPNNNSKNIANGGNYSQKFAPVLGLLETANLNCTCSFTDLPNFLNFGFFGLGNAAETCGTLIDDSNFVYRYQIDEVKNMLKNADNTGTLSDKDLEYIKEIAKRDHFNSAYGSQNAYTKLMEILK